MNALRVQMQNMRPIISETIAERASVTVPFNSFSKISPARPFAPANSISALKVVNP